MLAGRYWLQIVFPAGKRGVLSKYTIQSPLLLLVFCFPLEDDIGNTCARVFATQTSTILVHAVSSEILGCEVFSSKSEVPNPFLSGPKLCSGAKAA